MSLDNTIFNRVLRICLLMLHRGLTGADSRVLTESGYVWSSEGHVNVSEQLVVSGNKINLQFCIFVDITDWIKLGCCCHRSYGSGRKGPDGALIHTRATAQRGGKRLGEALIHTTTSAILSGGRSVGPTHDHATTKIAVICCCYKPEVSRPGLLHCTTTKLPHHTHSVSPAPAQAQSFRVVGNVTGTWQEKTTGACYVRYICATAIFFHIPYIIINLTQSKLQLHQLFVLVFHLAA